MDPDLSRESPSPSDGSNDKLTVSVRSDSTGSRHCHRVRDFTYRVDEGIHPGVRQREVSRERLIPEVGEDTYKRPVVSKLSKDPVSDIFLTTRLWK